MENNAQKKVGVCFSLVCLFMKHHKPFILFQHSFTLFDSKIVWIKKLRKFIGNYSQNNDAGMEYAILFNFFLFRYIITASVFIVALKFQRSKGFFSKTHEAEFNFTHSETLLIPRVIISNRTHLFFMNQIWSGKINHICIGFELIIKLHASFDGIMLLSITTVN